LKSIRLGCHPEDQLLIDSSSFTYGNVTASWGDVVKFSDGNANIDEEAGMQKHAQRQVHVQLKTSTVIIKLHQAEMSSSELISKMESMRVVAELQNMGLEAARQLFGGNVNSTTAKTNDLPRDETKCVNITAACVEMSRSIMTQSRSKQLVALADVFEIAQDKSTPFIVRAAALLITKAVCKQKVSVIQGYASTLDQKNFIPIELVQSLERQLASAIAKHHENRQDAIEYNRLLSKRTERIKKTGGSKLTNQFYVELQKCLVYQPTPSNHSSTFDWGNIFYIAIGLMLILFGMAGQAAGVAVLGIVFIVWGVVMGAFK
jgi:hypothetical protein